MSLVQSKNVFVAFAAFSMACSGAVLFTGIAFRSMRGRFFMHLIMCIAFCDMFVGLAGCFGFPHNGSVLCGFQAFIIILFLRANWLWTVMLCYQLHNVVLFSKVSLSYTKMHVIVWGTCLLLTLLPLIHARYGRGNSDKSVEFCFIESYNHHWYLFWVVFDWLVLLLVSILVMLMFLIRTKLYLMSLEGSESDSRQQQVYQSLYLYPLIIMITWLPSTLTNEVIDASSKGSTPSIADDKGLIWTQVLSMFNGILMAVVFFSKSPEARQRWWYLFQGTGIPDNQALLDFRDAEEYEPSSSSSGRQQSSSSKGSQPSATMSI